MSAVYVDTSVLLTATGDDAPDKPAAVDFLDRRHGRTLHVSVETIQEFLFHRMRRSTRDDALAQAEALMASTVIHDFDRDTMRRSIQLIRETSIRGRDAVHAATALIVGVDTLVTLDGDFAAVPGLRVIRPS